MKNEREKKKEVAIDSNKIDKLTDDYLVEVKKSDAEVKAVKWQILYYLKVLKESKSASISKKLKIDADFLVIAFILHLTGSKTPTSRVRGIKEVGGG